MKLEIVVRMGGHQGTWRFTGEDASGVGEQLNNLLGEPQEYVQFEEAESVESMVREMVKDNPSALKVFEAMRQGGFDFDSWDGGIEGILGLLRTP